MIEAIISDSCERLRKKNYKLRDEINTFFLLFEIYNRVTTHKHKMYILFNRMRSYWHKM
jgi:hypothetical protein